MMSGMTMIFLTVMFFPPGILSQALLRRHVARNLTPSCRLSCLGMRPAKLLLRIPPPRKNLPLPNRRAPVARRQPLFQLVSPFKLPRFPQLPPQNGVFYKRIIPAF